MNKTQVPPLKQIKSSGFSLELETKLFEVGEQLMAGQSHCDDQANYLFDRPNLCHVHQLAFMSDEHKSSLLFFLLTNGSESVCFRSRR